MIMHKEDLLNTYIKSGNPTLTKLYIEKLSECGLHDLSLQSLDIYHNTGTILKFPFIASSANAKVAQWWGYIHNTNFKELTLADLQNPKPDTSYKFTPLEEFSIFDLKEHLEDGSLFYSSNNNDFVLVMNEHALLKTIVDDKGMIYLREETKWQDCVRQHLESCDHGAGFIDVYVDSDLSKSRSLNDDDFLKMCRIALQAKGEI